MVHHIYNHTNVYARHCVWSLTKKGDNIHMKYRYVVQYAMLEMVFMPFLSKAISLYNGYSADVHQDYFLFFASRWNENEEIVSSVYSEQM